VQGGVIEAEGDLVPGQWLAAGYRGRDRAQADQRDPDHQISLPRQQDPSPWVTQRT